MAVILYDGECGMCRASVQFVLSRDRGGALRFASLQSEAGREILAEHGLVAPEFDTMYFLDGEKLYDRSSAALQIGRRLPYLAVLSRLALLVPRFLRDGVYDFIARNRHNWFDKNRCLVLTEEQRKRFLDLGE
ncbi:MAG: thiol-disulfide oxidoreductase [Roseibacillus sp.]|nr:thiol-disulfide oxidoreductase [Roseibacillus sp.]